MKHETLVELGFKLYGVEENDPYYTMIFKNPIKFGVYSIDGSITKEGFLLYQNCKVYKDEDKQELKKIIDIFK